MTYRILATLILFTHFLLSQKSFATNSQNNYIIQGYVKERNTKKNLSHVSIEIQESKISTTTTTDGFYRLSHIPEGQTILKISSLGYQTLTDTITASANTLIQRNYFLEESSVELNPIVVSANRTETQRKLAPTIVSVLTSKDFDITNSCNLSQGLNYQPGVRVETNCQNCGFQQVRINGLDGPYTQILIDSRPIFSSLASIYGLEQIPTNMIDRVEIIRGGGSALYGASAVAGTINIITKDPNNSGTRISHTTTGIQGFGTLAHQTTFNSEFLSQHKKSGISVFGATGSRGGFDANSDGFTELPKLQNQNLGLRFFLKTSNHSKLSAEYHFTHEFRRGGDSLNRPPHEALIAEQLKHNIHTGNLKYDINSVGGRSHIGIFASFQAINRDSYYGSGRNPSAYGQTANTTWMTGLQYNYNIEKCLFLPSTLTMGTEFKSDIVTDNMWGYDRYLHQNSNIFSFFAQNEWKSQQFSLLLGGRIDKHNLLKKPIFSPRANLRYSPNSNLILRATYASGFRAPQAFDEDLHIENVGGTVSMIVLSPKLKEEKSQNFGASADIYKRFGSWHTNLLFDGFYTKIYNVFALRDLGVMNNILIKERYNEQAATIYGINIEGRIALRTIFSLQAGLTLQQAKYRDPIAWTEEVTPTRRMFRAPTTYGYITSAYYPIKQLQIALSGTYTGSMLVEHRSGYIAENTTTKTPTFWVLNTKVTYDFKLFETNMQLSLGIQNILNAYQQDFDKGPDRDSAYIYGPASPRSFTAGISFFIP